MKNAGSERGTFSATPVQRPRQQVEIQLRTAIVDGSLTKGSKLPSELALAASFNVSRATIREALRSLTERGFLIRGDGATSGLFVQSVDHVTFSRVVSDRLTSILGMGAVSAEEVATFRDLLEVPSARLAAVQRLDAHLVSIREVIAQEQATTYDDPIVPELNARFHSLIAKASGNRVLASFVSALHRTAQPLAFLDMDHELGRVAVRHHLQIYRAIADRDASEAAGAMRRHLGFLQLHADANTHSAEEPHLSITVTPGGAGI